VSPRAAEAVDATLSALADPTRRRMIDLLRERPRRAGELAEAFDVSAPAVSRHLRVLRTRGLIEEEPAPHDARLRVYRLRQQPFQDLQQWLEDVEGFWSEQLDSFRDVAEARGRRTGRRNA
jgi:DNA-binding transcriptional ArsR family regulator